MIWRIITLLVLVLCSTPSVAQEEDVDWIIYLAVGPREAAIIQGYNHGDFDLTGYDFPLYVGYVYSDDSKSVNWHSEVDFAEEAISYWAKKRTEYPICYFSDVPVEVLEGTYEKAWLLSDPDFFDAAVILLRTEHLIPIRWERNVPIDKIWKPVFPKQIRIDGTVKEAQDDYSDAVKEARSKLIYLDGDYTPLNWAPKKNSQYVPRQKTKRGHLTN